MVFQGLTKQRRKRERQLVRGSCRILQSTQVYKRPSVIGNISAQRLFKRRDICSCLVAIVLLCLFQACTSYRTGVAPGDIAPTVAGSDLNGAQVSSMEFRGSYLVVNFLASWCTPCIAELPALERLNSDKIKVLGVGIDDDVDSLRRLAKKAGVTFPIIIDKGGFIKREFRVAAVPESYILSPKGEILLVPDNGGFVTKITGPRDWDGEMKRIIMSLSVTE